MHPKRVIVDGEDAHPRETDETFEHDRCGSRHRSLDQEVIIDTYILAALLCSSTDVQPAQVRTPAKLRSCLPHLAGPAAAATSGTSIRRRHARPRCSTGMPAWQNPLTISPGALLAFAIAQVPATAR